MYLLSFLLQGYNLCLYLIGNIKQRQICSLKQLQAYSPTEKLPSRDENNDYMKYHVHIEKHVFSPNLVVKEEQA